MEKPDYHGILGIARDATAAEIEERYLALASFLDSAGVPSELRRWASAQSALADEAYAALTGSGDDEAVTVVAPANQAAIAADRQTVRRYATATVSQPPRIDDEEEEEDYDEDFDDEPVERARQAPPKPTARQSHGRPGASGRADRLDDGQRWQERGKKGRRRDHSAVPAPRRRQAAGAGSKIILGIVAGLIVVAAIVGLTQAGIGPFVDSGAQGDAAPAFDQARYEQLKALVQREPNNYAALFELGEMNIDAERWEETITWFEKLLVVRPGDVHAMQDIGTAHFNLGRYDQARQVWLKALEVDPQDAQTHWNLSFLYARVQPPEMEKAVEAWKKVVELSPGSELARTAQAHIDSYSKKGNPAEAPAQK